MVPDLLLYAADRYIQPRCCRNLLWPIPEIISFHKGKKQVSFKELVVKFLDPR